MRGIPCQPAITPPDRFPHFPVLGAPPPAGLAVGEGQAAPVHDTFIAGGLVYRPLALRAFS